MVPNLQIVLFVFLFVYIFLFILIIAQLFYLNNLLQIQQRFGKVNQNFPVGKKHLSLQVRLHQMWEDHTVFYIYSFLIVVATLIIFQTGFSSGKLLLMTAIYLLGLFFIKLLFELNEQSLRKQIMNQFPDVVDVLANHVAIGNSLLDAIRVASEYATGLLKLELAFLHHKISLGASPTDVMFKIAKKYNVFEFYYFSIIVSIHLKTGSHIAQLLHDMANVLRERRYALMKVRALFSQVKISGIIIAFLPPAFLILISIIRPDFWMPYLTNPLAQKILFVCFGLELFGIFMLRKLSKVNI
ncbi:MAG: hypothetical protein AMJ43_05495 [Coxiella sp. DG_40]|nr:MAG: hypothetical protein AMJ43_05495 [Coxiella sp. DG_40]